MQNPFSLGERLYLRGLERRDLVDVLRWSNDAEVTYYMFTGALPGNIENLEKEYEQTNGSRSDVAIAVIDKKTDTPIGTTGFYAINWITRSAEFRIFLGEKGYWSNGYGTETTELCLAYGFDKLNLNRIWLGTNAGHQGAIKCYHKAGFTDEGVLRQEMYRHGVYSDVVRMSILREEYYARKAG